NRDEHRVRAPEIAPREQTTPEGVRYLAPEDSEAGGTWITANEFGVTVALLNGYIESLGPARNSYESRGALVRALAGVESPEAALRWLGPRSLEIYRPAVVFVKAPETPALVARWDGRSVAIDMEGERQLPLTSSSYEQDEVQRTRRALYEEIVHPGKGGDRRQPDARRLKAFQSHVDPTKGPTPFTPSMERPDAATRSQCHIEVDGQAVRFEYRPGAPHNTDVSDSLVLDLLAASSKDR
ncbi:MAG: NRDE family protein, partial [Planctomycetota bacterium]